MFPSIASTAAVACAAVPPQDVSLSRYPLQIPLHTQIPPTPREIKVLSTMYGGSILWEFSMLVCSWAYRTTHIVFSWFALVALEKKVEFTDYYLSSSNFWNHLWNMIMGWWNHNDDACGSALRLCGHRNDNPPSYVQTFLKWTCSKTRKLTWSEPQGWEKGKGRFMCMVLSSGLQPGSGLHCTIDFSMDHLVSRSFHCWGESLSSVTNGYSGSVAFR